MDMRRYRGRWKWTNKGVDGYEEIQGQIENGQPLRQMETGLKQG
jgi:hypothetical protein